MTGSHVRRPAYVRWLLWLLVVCLIAGFLSLARWQKNRGDAKQVLQDMQLQRMDNEPIPLSRFSGGLEKGRYLPVMVSGQADGRYQFLLDNQNRQGRGAGYWVLLPVRLDSGDTVLVNRGWVAATGYREQLPDVTVPTGPVKLQAYLDAFPEPGIKLEGAEVPAAGWPAVIQWVDRSQLRKRLGEDVLPYQAVLKSGQPFVLAAIQPTLPMGPAKHYGYAFQWASLALALLLLSIWVDWKSCKADQ